MSCLENEMALSLVFASIRVGCRGRLFSRDHSKSELRIIPLSSGEQRLRRSSAHICLPSPMGVASSELKLIFTGVLRRVDRSPELTTVLADIRSAGTHETNKQGCLIIFRGNPACFSWSKIGLHKAGGKCRCAPSARCGCPARRCLVHRRR